MTNSQRAIRAVVFDADGVVQRNPPGWLERVKRLCDNPSQADEFAQALFAAERPTMVGDGDFTDELTKVLNRWNSSMPIAEALLLWRQIEPNPATFAQVHALRSAGFIVVLGTNQQAYRANYMRNELNYSEVFDEVFCSCDLGCRKPSAAFFRSILDKLDLEPNQVLLIDDDAKNITAAESTGLRAAHYHLEQGSAVLNKLLSTLGLPAQTRLSSS